MTEPSLPTTDPPRPVTIGPFTFRYQPDGQDGGSGWLYVDFNRHGIKTWQATRAEWDAFVCAALPAETTEQPDERDQNEQDEGDHDQGVRADV